MQRFVPVCPVIPLVLLVLVACVGCDNDPTGDAGPGSADAAAASGSGPEDSLDSGASAPSHASGDASGDASVEGEGTRVELKTSLGVIVVQLDEDKAPITSANFLAYVKAGFYDGDDDDGRTVFHRVIDGFVVQGGGLRADLSPKLTMDPIANESDNGLLNLRGSLSMARTNDPNSATSQFFINLEDNSSLDAPPGYAVFAHVVDGMDVVDDMAKVAVISQAQHTDVPADTIAIKAARVLD